MTTRYIGAHIQDIYGISVSYNTISYITNRIVPIVKVWQQPLEYIYAVEVLDAIQYHVRTPLPSAVLLVYTTQEILQKNL